MGMGEAGEMSGKRQFLEETWTRGTAGRDLCGNSLGRGYEQKRASCLVIVNNGLKESNKCLESYGDWGAASGHSDTLIYCSHLLV
jgi:hypothetical protein